MAKTAEEKAAAKAAKDAAAKAEADRRAALTPEERAAEDAAKGAPKPKGTEPIVVKFRDHEGKPTDRTFSKEVHGDDFAAQAEEFKTTNASKLIKE